LEARRQRPREIARNHFVLSLCAIFMLSTAIPKGGDDTAQTSPSDVGIAVVRPFKGGGRWKRGENPPLTRSCDRPRTSVLRDKGTDFFTGNAQRRCREGKVGADALFPPGRDRPRSITRRKPEDLPPSVSHLPRVPGGRASAQTFLSTFVAATERDCLPPIPSSRWEDVFYGVPAGRSAGIGSVRKRDPEERT
jgi:hypothetical protein